VYFVAFKENAHPIGEFMCINVKKPEKNGERVFLQARWLDKCGGQAGHFEADQSA
jgi:hypothetical protein